MISPQLDGRIDSQFLFSWHREIKSHHVAFSNRTVPVLGTVNDKDTGSLRDEMVLSGETGKSTPRDEGENTQDEAEGSSPRDEGENTRAEAEGSSPRDEEEKTRSEKVTPRDEEESPRNGGDGGHADGASPRFVGEFES